MGATSRVRSLRDTLILGSGSDPGREPSTPQDVLRFWFGRLPGPRFGTLDALWLPTRIPCWGGHWASRVLDVDRIITEYFGRLHARATRDELDAWSGTPEGRLALVILLDQLSRNIHRGKPAAFANDDKVLPLVEDALERGDDRLFNPLARTLLYLPLMHHERAELLARCISLYEAAHADAKGVARVVLGVELASARRHAEIFSRFGRYPHRNEILGRESTPEELQFLKENFSSF
jgi:uncharacterized protein (DUF924 family)